MGISQVKLYNKINLSITDDFVCSIQMSVRASYWSVTINNPTDSDEYNIAQCRQRGWKVEGQLEQGEKGTPHYQLYVRTPQVRFSAIKQALPRAHIEVARNVSALQAYVKKSDTRLGDLKVDQSMYPTQLQVFRWFAFYYRDAKEINPKCSNLEIFDLMIGQKIRQGYYIGAECMNPQIRAYIKKFGADLAHRELTSLDRQTDRQAKLISQSVTIPQNANASPPLSEEETDSSPSDDERSP